MENINKVRAKFALFRVVLQRRVDGGEGYVARVFSRDLDRSRIEMRLAEVLTLQPQRGHAQRAAECGIIVFEIGCRFFW
jgi:hypothetical protein